MVVRLCEVPSGVGCCDTHDSLQRLSDSVCVCVCVCVYMCGTSLVAYTSHVHHLITQVDGPSLKMPSSDDAQSVTVVVAAMPSNDEAGEEGRPGASPPMSPGSFGRAEMFAEVKKNLLQVVKNEVHQEAFGFSEIPHRQQVRAYLKEVRYACPLQCRAPASVDQHTIDTHGVVTHSHQQPPCANFLPLVFALMEQNFPPTCNPQGLGDAVRSGPREYKAGVDRDGGVSRSRYHRRCAQRRTVTRGGVRALRSKVRDPALY